MHALTPLKGRGWQCAQGCCPLGGDGARRAAASAEAAELARARPACTRTHVRMRVRYVSRRRCKTRKVAMVEALQVRGGRAERKQSRTQNERARALRRISCAKQLDKEGSQK
eukprot:6213585-Pleurochrysis_carterae.AAC.6